MKKIKELNLLDDKGFQIKLNIGGIILGFLFSAIFFAIAIFIPQKGENMRIENDFLSLIAFLVTYWILIFLHELIHGLFYKLFSPDHKLEFGFNGLVAYAASPGSRYTRVQLIIIALAPLLIISLIMILLYASTHLHVMPYSLLAGFHAGGCVGDLYYVYLILKSPQGTIIEDTDKGIDFYI